MLEIKIGSGNFIVSGIEKEGKKGIAVFYAKDHGYEIDTPISIAETGSKECVCQIWFEGIDSARMFQDQVNSMCLRIKGYEVENK